MFMCPLRGVLFGTAADFADHHDGFGVRIGLERGQCLLQCGADNRVATGAKACGEPDVGELSHKLVSQRTGLGHEPQGASRHNAVGDDAQIDAMRFAG